MSSLSIVIPVLNEADNIVSHVEKLRDTISTNSTISVEVIIVDGGSNDDTQALASPYAEKVITSEKGRAKQMNAGASAASGDYLLFLHIDTVLPDSAFGFLQKENQWGFYRILLSGKAWPFRVIEKMMTWRSSLSKVATGDQCIFIHRDLFNTIKGYADLPLMEDVELCKRLRKIAKPLIIKNPVITSSRRWEEKGICKTIWLMWCLRLQYFFGVSAEALVDKYYKS